MNGGRWRQPGEKPSIEDKDFLVGIVERFCPEVKNPETLPIHRLVGRIYNRKEAREYFAENHVPLNVMPPGLANKQRKKAVVPSTGKDWRQESRDREAAFILAGDKIYREQTARRRALGLAPD